MQKEFNVLTRSGHSFPVKAERYETGEPWLKFFRGEVEVAIIQTADVFAVSHSDAIEVKTESPQERRQRLQ